MKIAHVPIRTCLGCGQRKEKGELARIVIKNSVLAIDEAQSMQGRGAYLCSRRACADLLLKKKGRLSHALRVALSCDGEKGFLQGLFYSRGTGEEW
jgi:hypothetical protein